MASPGGSPTLLVASRNTPEGLLQDLSSPPLQGWKKKFIQKRGRTPKQKDVSYITPDGEEIRSKRQLEKYLKGHPGGPTASDFDWTSGESPRRSLRLSSKGQLSGDSLEGDMDVPVTKHSKQVVHDTAKEIVSPVVGAKGKKGAKSTAAASLAGNEEEMEDAKKDTPPVQKIQAMEEKPDLENVTSQRKEASITVDDKFVKDAEHEKVANKATDEPVLMNTDVPPSATNGDALEADKNIVKEGTVKEIAAEIDLSAVATTMPKEDELTSKHEEKHDVAVTSEVTAEKPSVGGLSIQNREKEGVDWLETQIAVPALTAEMMPKPSAVEEEMTTEPNTEVKSAEEIQNEQIINFLTEKPLEEDEEVNGVDMDTLVDGNQQEVESKAVELPQPQGIHVLVHDSATFRGGAKPQEEAPHVLSEAPHPVGISI